MKKEAPEQTTVLGQTPLSLLLDEIEERAKKAMAGPWSRDPTGDVGEWLVGTPIKPIADCDFAELSGVQIAGNSDFIASARTDVPALVKVVQHLRECIKAECSGVVAQACDMEAATILREGK